MEIRDKIAEIVCTLEAETQCAYSYNDEELLRVADAIIEVLNER